MVYMIIGTNNCKAHDDLYVAIKRGRIQKPSKCEWCWLTIGLHGHHENYNEALEVWWLCTKCHAVRHRMWEALTKMRRIFETRARLAIYFENADLVRLTDRARQEGKLLAEWARETLL